MTRISPNLETGIMAKKKVGLMACSNCWICEGWTQVTFRYSPETPLDHYDLVYCCINIDGFEPDLMI